MDLARTSHLTFAFWCDNILREHHDNPKPSIISKKKKLFALRFVEALISIKLLLSPSIDEKAEDE